MSATASERSAATDATSVRLKFDAIDRRAGEMGVDTELGLARLLELDRSSLYRFRRQQINPSLNTALRIALILGVAVEEVAERVES